MKEIIDILISRLGQYFWLSICLTASTLVYLAKNNNEFFNYNLFQNRPGIAQAILIFILVMSSYYLFLSFSHKVIIFFQNVIYACKVSENKNIEQQAQQIQFLEDLFNTQRQTPYTGEVNVSNLKLYLRILYQKNIRKFKATDISDIFQEEANERQKLEIKSNVYCIPYVTKDECIKIQNLLHGFNFVFFNGELYEVNNIIFQKLDELKNRGML